MQVEDDGDNWRQRDGCYGLGSSFMKQFYVFHRMSDDGGGDYSICIGGEIGKFSFLLLVAGKKLFSVAVISDGQ